MAKQIGIDLGTSNTRIFLKDKGIVLRAPSVVTIYRASHEVLTAGAAAKSMIGKTPGTLRALRPLKAGVITDLEVTSLMLHRFFENLDMTTLFNRPSALVSIPYGITEVERRAVEDAVFEAGAKNVCLIEEPIAAARGSGIDISKARGSMVIDLGGGVSEASVISYGGLVNSNSIRTAGDELDRAIINFLKEERNVLIGEISAEMLKKRIGAVGKTIDRGSAEVCGRDLRTGRAVTVEVSSRDIRRAIGDAVQEILTMVKQTLEETDPELSSDIFDLGIVLVGGGALLPGMADLIHDTTGIRVIVPQKPRPMDCVCTGLGRMLQSVNGDFSELVKYKVK